MSKKTNKQPRSKTSNPLVGKMGFLAHCIELRKRLFCLVSYFLLSFLITYFFSTQIYNFLLIPLENLNNSETSRRLIFTALPEAFTSYIKLSLFVGFLISFPYINWHLYKFITPGLYKNEKQSFQLLLLLSPILFYFGCFFAYYFIFPMAWKFFISFENHTADLPIILEAKISEYLTFSTKIIIAFGLAFQLPILLTLLIKSRIITRDSLAKKRKYAILLFFVIGAIITPPDVISQIGIVIPMYLLYELTLLFSKKKKISTKH